MVDTSPKVLSQPAAGRTARPSRALEYSALCLLALMAAVGLHRVFLINVNWDEFFYLSFVYDHQRGALSSPLQTIQVHLFGWLPWIGGGEVAQVIAARIAIYGLQLGSGALIYATARRVCSPVAALFPVLFFFSFSYVVDHGASFRADPLCAFLFLLALFLVSGQRRPAPALVGAAAAVALAGLISIKTAFYLPTLGLALIAPALHPGARGRAIGEAALFAAACAGIFAALYALHAQTLADPAAVQSPDYVAGAAAKTLDLSRLLPRSYGLVRALRENAIVWLFAAGGLWLALRGLARGPGRGRALVLASLALPLLALPVYRNAFPYFYVFLMAPVVILTGPCADWLVRGVQVGRSRVALAALAGALALSGLGFATHYVKRLPGQIAAQAELVALVHRLFPEPVPYLDRSEMIASFPGAGFLMSTWGMEAYRDAGRRVMRDIVAGRQPKFVIANTPALALDRPQSAAQGASRYHLFPEDFEVLRANYVPHWGALFVAGKAFDPAPGGAPQIFEILIPGTYTLEAAETVRIDRMAVRPGDTVTLAAGRHVLAPGPMGGRVVLRWGDRLERPAHAPSTQPIFYAF